MLGFLISLYSVDIPNAQIPFATPIPGRPHAVSCSFPTMGDVIRYEENDPTTREKIQVAYPRFVTHHRVREWERRLKRKFDLPDKVVYCVCSTRAAKEMQRYVGIAAAKVFAGEAYAVVAVDTGGENELKARKFLQHTGCRISSRQAESLLQADGLVPGDPAEPDACAYETLVEAITEKTGARANEDVYLTNSGMSAVHAAFQAVREIQARKDRCLWIQLGWIYVDTYEILNKFAGDDDQKIFIPDPTNLDALAAVLAEQGGRVAGIIAELPTNPLVQTPDIDRLFELARSHGVALIVDPTVSSILNVDLLPYCDLLVTSLTKYVSHEGDVLMGAVVLAANSPFFEALASLIGIYAEPPFHADVSRVVEQLGRMDEVARIVNANTLALAAFFEQHPGVKKVFWAYGGDNRPRYEKIEKEPGSPGSMVTIDLVKPVAAFYDVCRISKGPSFGMERTLMSPFMYMAHYDIVSREDGKDELRAYGINPDLIRISVGTEPIEQIIAAFDEAL